ncbi:hypothetical protein [Lactobacillus sp.]|uniref:hypothetical protein n=1 Tax=Lactobacillus sp. TaxID=1591 RepID=UPI003EF3EEFE
MKKIMSILLATGLAFSLSGCQKANNRSNTENKHHVVSQESEIKSLKKYHPYVWTVYWGKNDNLTSLYQNSGNLSGIGDFAAYYTSSGKIFLPRHAEDLVSQANASTSLKCPVYLTVVNDTAKEQKSQALLEKILKDAATQTKAAKAIVSLAKKEGFSGVELDYENLGEARDLWQKYFAFEKILYSLCQKDKLKLRVLLEPKVPKLAFPSGPTYVVMCYNLYGYGTKAGPKADYAFLDKTAKKFAYLKPDYALADGGFAFGKNVTPLTPSQIQQEGSRDAKSGALHYQKGGKTVWYADGQTLKRWADRLQKHSSYPIKISLWRLE